MGYPLFWTARQSSPEQAFTNQSAKYSPCETNAEGRPESSQPCKKCCEGVASASRPKEVRCASDPQPCHRLVRSVRARDRRRCRDRRERRLRDWRLHGLDDLERRGGQRRLVRLHRYGSPALWSSDRGAAGGDVRRDDGSDRPGHSHPVPGRRARAGTDAHAVVYPLLREPGRRLLQPGHAGLFGIPEPAVPDRHHGSGRAGGLRRARRRLRHRLPDDAGRPAVEAIYADDVRPHPLCRTDGPAPLRGGRQPVQLPSVR
jgi:hypothetical protein